jgi:hypothetical protein
MNTSLLKDKVTKLQRLVWLQRSIRFSLQALWLGVAGYLLGWSINIIWGWMPNPKTWLIISLFFMIVPLRELLTYYPRPNRLVWNVDRKFKLSEQVSTAWSVAQKDQPGSLLEEKLIDDVLLILAPVRDRILKRGFFLNREIISLCIMMILFGGLYLTQAISSNKYPVGETNLAPLPPLGEEPRIEDVFPAGILQLQAQATPNPTEKMRSADEAGTQEGAAQIPDPEMLAKSFQRLGSNLSDISATYDLGQALQKLDPAKAAAAMENLADQLNELSSDTKENLAEAMQKASEELQQSEGDSQKELSMDLNNAADLIKKQATEDSTGNASSGTNPSQEPGEASNASQSGQTAKDAMYQVARDLREIAQQLQPTKKSAEVGSGGVGAGAGVGGVSREKGQPVSTSRLSGEGETIEFSSQESSETGLLSSTPPNTTGTGTASGSVNITQGTDQNVIQTYIIPINYTWNWWYVVSTYFQPR